IASRQLCSDTRGGPWPRSPSAGARMIFQAARMSFLHSKLFLETVNHPAQARCRKCDEEESRKEAVTHGRPQNSQAKTHQFSERGQDVRQVPKAPARETRVAVVNYAGASCVQASCNLSC